MKHKTPNKTQKMSDPWHLLLVPLLQDVSSSSTVCHERAAAQKAFEATKAEEARAGRGEGVGLWVERESGRFSVFFV